MELDDLAIVPGPGTDLAAWSVLVRTEPLVVALHERPDDDTVAAVVPGLRAMPTVVVLAARPDHAPAELVDAVDVAITDVADPPWPWVQGAVDDVAATVADQPTATLALAALLRTSATLPVWDAVVAEAATYAMLLGSRAHLGWLEAHRGGSPSPAAVRPAVASTRAGDELRIELDRPEVHNAVDSALRDALVEALVVPVADPSITTVDLRGRGPSFCSGGDLQEFGTVGDGATAFAVRLARHPGLAVHAVADRTTARLHGACIGAGIEIAAFATHVVADPEAAIRLPEVGMGLVPGAGGTASVTRRVGRHRSAWLALTGHPIDAARALAWGLVDELAPRSDWPT